MDTRPTSSLLFQLQPESQASTGQLLPGSSSISSHPRVGTGEWVRVSCLREHRTQHDSNVPLACAKARSDARINYLWSLFFPGLAWCPLLTAELSLRAWKSRLASWPPSWLKENKVFYHRALPPRTCVHLTRGTGRKLTPRLSYIRCLWNLAPFELIWERDAHTGKLVEPERRAGGRLQVTSGSACILGGDLFIHQTLLASTPCPTCCCVHE